MSKLHSNRVEMGTMTTTQRDALSSPPAGTIIYNSTVSRGQMYDGSDWKDMTLSGVSGASGGTSTPGPSGTTIRYFTSSTNFTYSDATGQSIDVVVVGGGGGGGDRGGGGGGGGGVIYYPNLPLAAYPGSTTIPITIGSGGSGYNNGSGSRGDQAGTSSKFGSSPQPSIYLVALGGGGGRCDNYDSRNNNPDTTSTPQQARGGSGGGQHECTSGHVTDANGVQTSDPAIPANSRTYGYGNPGGRANPSSSDGSGCPLVAGGGGGAVGGRPGNDAPGSAGGAGGPGVGPPIIPWMPTSLGDSGYFGGGGGGGVHGPPSTGGAGGPGGGGAARGRSGPYSGYSGTNGTGGGGGGSSVNNGNAPESASSGNGGNGIVIIRYTAGD